MLLDPAFLACWPNISKYAGEHYVDASQPTEKRCGGKQSSKLSQIALTYEHTLIYSKVSYMSACSYERILQ